MLSQVVHWLQNLFPCSSRKDTQTIACSTLQDVTGSEILQQGEEIFFLRVSASSSLSFAFCSFDVSIFQV